MSISRFSEDISHKPVNLPTLLQRGTPEPNIHGPIYPIVITQILQELLDLQDASNGIVDEKLIIRDVAMGGFPCRIEVVAGYRELAALASMGGM